MTTENAYRKIGRPPPLSLQRHHLSLRSVADISMVSLAHPVKYKQLHVVNGYAIMTERGHASIIRLYIIRLYKEAEMEPENEFTYFQQVTIFQGLGDDAIGELSSGCA